MEEIKKGLESLIEAVAVGLREKKDFFDRGCKSFSEACLTKMRNYAETGNLCDKKCEYCEKFKWVVDRAKHYAEKTGLTYEQVLEGWEKRRDYWFLNYYQDSNQPVLNERVRIFKTLKELQHSMGQAGFRCPRCGGISTDAYECNSGLPIVSNGKSIPCNWKAYGLFGCLGRGAHIYVIDECIGETIFMPIAWENKE